MGYVGRHWRGELSLAVAFWVNNVLIWLPLGFALGLLAAWIELWGQSLQTASAVALALTLVLSTASIWAPVGAWRSAAAYRASGGSPGLAFAARLLLGLAFLGTVLNLVVDVLPELPALLRQAAGHDPIGRLDIALAPDGRSVHLSGPIGAGSAARFESALRDAPALRRVQIESPGGRLFEADRIARAVRARNLATRAGGDCASACTLVFVAGAERSLAPSARLGFHRASASTTNPLHDRMANQALADLYEDAGLPRRFTERVLEVPASRMWYPGIDVLVGAGILPQPTLLPQLDDSLPTAATLDHYRDALAGNLLWSALEERRAGTIAAAAERIRDAHGAGNDIAATAAAGRAVALAAAPEVLRSANPTALNGYVALLAADWRERRAHGGTCRAGLDTAAHPERVAAWLQQALIEPAEKALLRPLTPIEAEVLRREMGSTGAAHIAALAGSPRRAALGCDQAIAALDAIARLKAPQRRLALRLLLTPS